MGFEGKGQLQKGVLEYKRGEKVVVEVVEANGMRVRVKDVGRW